MEYVVSYTGRAYVNIKLKYIIRVYVFALWSFRAYPKLIVSMSDQILVVIGPPGWRSCDSSSLKIDGRS